MHYLFLYFVHLHLFYINNDCRKERFLYTTLHSALKSPQCGNVLRTRHISIYHNLQCILEWGTNRILRLKASKPQYCMLPHKKFNNSYIIVMQGVILHNNVSFDMVDVSCSRHLNSQSDYIYCYYYCKKILHSVSGYPYLVFVPQSTSNQTSNKMFLFRE